LRLTKGFVQLHLHTGGVESLKDVPQDILPEDYGGQAPSTPKIHGKLTKQTLVPHTINKKIKHPLFP